MRSVTIAAVQMALQEADVAGNTVRAMELLERAGREGAGRPITRPHPDQHQHPHGHGHCG